MFMLSPIHLSRYYFIVISSFERNRAGCDGVVSAPMWLRGGSQHRGRWLCEFARAAVTEHHKLVA